MPTALTHTYAARHDGWMDDGGVTRRQGLQVATPIVQEWSGVVIA